MHQIKLAISPFLSTQMSYHMVNNKLCRKVTKRHTVIGVDVTVTKTANATSTMTNIYLSIAC